MAYNKEQWLSSFEDQLSLRRPHLTMRVLAAMSLSAWNQFGTEDEDPIKVAQALSTLLDKQAADKKA